MRALSRLPHLSLAYAQGQDPLTAGDQAANDRLRESEYNGICANPSDAEVQLVEGISSIAACALAFGEIEGCKGRFWEKRDVTCWWSDYDHVADLNTGTADVCTNATGHVYLVGRKESLESCNKAKQECLEEAKGLRKEISNLQEELNTLRRTWGKMLIYPQKRITSSKYWPTVEPSRNGQGYY
ncbi:hypothetical protein BDV24DRAFT_160498 [Aspergillus arachidicola]|uniref:Uncharacterized protein n=1 Tax=Aspergillus arachidicola TaxID=656916 RepID=A0A2G7GBA1_9EURO|nr:hypothetical protein BDV24DRAFT_160498 [Aspergillus arachidicola]PIG90097.1 hypothetical protein AARAC_001890 [Aspergillus arachidicola]